MPAVKPRFLLLALPFLFSACAEFNHRYSVCQEARQTPEEYRACKEDERRGPRSNKGLQAAPGHGNPGIL